MNREKYHIENYINTGSEKSFVYLMNRIKRLVNEKIERYNLDVDQWLYEDLVHECMCYVIENINRKDTFKSIAYDYHWKIELEVLSTYLECKYQLNLNHNTVKRLYMELIKLKWLTVRDVSKITKETAISESVVIVLHNILHGNDLLLDADRYEPYDSSEEYYDGIQIGNTDYEPYNIMCSKDVDRLIDVAVKYFKSKKRGMLDLYTIIIGNLPLKDKMRMCGISDTRIRQILKKEILEFKSEKMVDRFDYVW